MEKDMLNKYLSTVEVELSSCLEQLDYSKIEQAAELIIEARAHGGRVHITGIGKPSYVAGYLSALLSSTGTPAYKLDATECVHGSAGQVLAGDVVIAISNSGQTEELMHTVNAIARIGCKVIGVTGNPNSWLAEQAEVALLASVMDEGDDLNKPPRMSILSEIIVLQALSIVLQEEYDLDLNDYYLWHPGGALGKSAKEQLDQGVI